MREGTVHITAQNHGYAVDADSIAGSGLQVSHINLNDGTVEGMMHERLPIMTIQFHPEASGGPRDTEYMFDEFVRLVAQRKTRPPVHGYQVVENRSPRTFGNVQQLTVAAVRSKEQHDT